MSVKYEPVVVGNLAGLIKEICGQVYIAPGIRGIPSHADSQTLQLSGYANIHFLAFLKQIVKFWHGTAGSSLRPGYSRLRGTGD